ncbi:hypothetical protein K466DRAFT_616908 [Polyporus arcularius HHB13444]|uniref:Homeobox domain-containing protein n=1 Tax=Polyporus arcularius HHB13444 TaxID=1314778 RepID=A0A5C3NJS6_9APHY|nr:hypothetical protein K466DRAFT_616908 [Polyporus arcularius HHB13444]
MDLPASMGCDHYESGHHPQTAYSGTGNYASGSMRASTSASGVAGAGVYGTTAPAGQAVATHEPTYRPSARDTYTTPTAEGSPMTHDQARNFLEEFYAANDGNKRPGPEQRATLAGITGLNIDYVANWFNDKRRIDQDYVPGSTPYNRPRMGRLNEAQKAQLKVRLDRGELSTKAEHAVIAEELGLESDAVDAWVYAQRQRERYHSQKKSAQKPLFKATPR